MLKKIISGGQTGADQAGLDAAIENNIPHGGAIPKGRQTEVGVLPDKYSLEEMTTKSYPKRTEKNVVDSNGTVIFTHGKLTGGSLLTRKKAIDHNKHVLHLDMDKTDVDEAVCLLKVFIHTNNIDILNVAGSRTSKDAKIYGATYAVISTILS